MLAIGLNEALKTNANVIVTTDVDGTFDARDIARMMSYLDNSDMKNPKKTTTIKRRLDEKNSSPLKIVTGKKNCAILRIENTSSQRLLDSLENDKRYSEFIILSPFTKDGIEFTRILFLDADYVKRNEKYILGFDSLATSLSLFTSIY